ncbi:MAG: 2-amino-4-hydroxy-6-hydroxymethyldihydropteridine diphosphokinase [Brachybacterium sp.]|nr:2-amino-4-hydroxy-6-hydroxymethyldihydropteridine diphosphokinase [Brachybacterium sp.]
MSRTRDVISLRGLRAHGRHGVLPEEKREGHHFLLDLDLHLDLGPAGRTDDLARTVHYGEVAQLAVDVVTGPSRDLIETLAEDIADRVLAAHPLVRRIDVTLHKPTAPIGHPVDDVAVRIHRAAAPTSAVLALGSNIGDRAHHLARATELLSADPDVTIVWQGPVIETEPVGGPEQDRFLNTVLGIDTTLGPFELLDLAHAVEADAHRERTVRWGPRTLDVDVITYGQLVQDDPELTLPHPRAHQRGFVLQPWASTRPDDVLPGHGPVGELLKALDP